MPRSKKTLTPDQSTPEYGVFTSLLHALPSPVEPLTVLEPTDLIDDDEDSPDDATDAITAILTDAIRLDNDGVFRKRVTLEKDSGRRIDLAKVETHYASILAASLNADRVKRGWSVGFATPVDDDEDVKTRFDARYPATGSPSDGWTYSVDVLVECRPKTVRRTLPMEFENIVAAMDAKARLQAYRWRVAKVDGKPYVPGETQKIEADPNEELGYAPFDLPDVHADPCDDRCTNGERACWIANFSHLYGLEDYIEIIRSTLELAVMSEWRDRVNIALIGPPACGKTELCKAVKRAVGDEAVLEYDATSTSMAGAQEQLGQMEEMPRIMVLEEIEKAPESALPWLLSVLDLRGEVRKKTMRTDIAKSVHMVGICTVNDEAKFNSVASGALASRFSMPLYFNRPPREILWRILKREVDKIGGKVAWIDPAIDFAEELQNASQGSLYIDPRKLIAICLTGRDRLLLPQDHPQSFQGMYRRTMRRAAGKPE